MTRPITAIFHELADIRSQLASLAAQTSPLQEAEAALRTELHDKMQASETKTIEGSGLQAVRSRRKSVRVTDEHEFRAYLASEGLEGAYMKLDMVSARKDAAKHGWPGVEEVVTDVLSIREAK